MKVAAAQFGAGTDVAVNVANAVHLIGAARRDLGADLVVLPEFFNTIYFPQYASPQEYWRLAERRDGPSLSAVRAAAAANNVHVIATLYEEVHDGLRHDTAFVIDRSGEIAGSYRKTHAPLIENGYEKLYYTPGTQYPTFEIDQWRCGITICYDWRFPEAARSLAVQGTELIIMPFAARRTRMWVEAIATRAWENQVYVAACNKVGKDGGWNFAGRSLIVNPFGDIVAEANSESEEIIATELERTVLRDARTSDFNWRDRRPELYSILTRPPDVTA